MGEHSFDAWPIGGPEHLVWRVAGNRQTEADALGRHDGGGPRLSLSGETKDQFTGAVLVAEADRLAGPGAQVPVMCSARIGTFDKGFPTA